MTDFYSPAINKKKSNNGKATEDKVRKALVILRDEHNGAFVRLYDTTSTGGRAILPETPCDYIFARNGKACLLEAKSSSEKESLTGVQLSAYIKPSQFLAARVWTGRAGVPSYFLFHSLKTGLAEIWSSAYVVGCKDSKEKIKIDKVLHRFVMCDEELVEALIKLTN